ncbi:isoflavone reductase homolog [Lolium rigidum]|uniref:isoflavone reductase homolog n=1 Tax=Lolium rigidum TaxID=89674 RepID=UPI001F5DE687|nr:isoflavone reductase homolog [Lolium rigidum]
MEKSKVLVVGGTGYIGRRMVRASLAQGHRTFVLTRLEKVGMDIDKLQLLLSFKAQGAVLVEASMDDHRSLVAAVKRADVVVSAMGGPHLLQQLKLVEAIKEAGNIQRFLPSEFGMDPARMGHALAPGRVTFDNKMVIRKAIEEANIPHTYVSANCFAAYFAANLSQIGTLLPPKEKVHVYGDGNAKGKEPPWTYICMPGTLRLNHARLISRLVRPSGPLLPSSVKGTDRSGVRMVYLEPHLLHRAAGDVPPCKDFNSHFHRIAKGRDLSGGERRCVSIGGEAVQDPCTH